MAESALLPRAAAANNAAANAAAATADPAANQAPPPRTTVVVRGLRDVLARGDYCGIFLDQFGVLHDGRSAYPRAAEAIGNAAADAALAIVVVSNSSRRAAGALARLEALGFRGDWFAGAVTSGEVTHQALSADPCAEEDAAWAMMMSAAEEGGKGGGGSNRPRRRTRCLHLTWAARGGSATNGGGVALPEGYVTVSPDDDAETAELIVAHGTEGVALPGGEDGNSSGVAPMPLRELEALLDRCAARQGGSSSRPPPPMVVANPDFVTVDGPGKLAVMPGTLARYYASKGGTVVLMGKPSARIYEAARALAGAAAGGGRGGAGEEEEQEAQEGSGQKGRRRRWLAIGDSLEHDVAGAAAAGDDVDALFVAAGIHADDLGFEPPDNLAEGNEGVVKGAWAEALAGGGGEEGAPPRGEAEARLAELCARLGVKPPAYATGYLQW
jgi:ribonucleotide monophosphatase NagD (HAD superfamily)